MMKKRYSTLCLAGLAALGFVLSAKAGGDGFFDKFDQLNKFRWTVSDGWANGDYQACEFSRSALATGNKGLEFTLSDKAGKTRPYICPELHTDRRYGYGVYEARMRVASGPGLNTAFFTYIGPPNGVPQHDEIDDEFLGKDTNFLSAGWWVDGKGQPGKMIALGFDASKALHDYAIEWLPNKIRWYVDGKMMFETDDGAPLPTHPQGLYFSLWAGAPSKDSWLGHFQYASPAKADIAWTGFTPMGEKCLFPESVTCK